MAFNLSGKVALVTGTSRGLGKAIALELAAQGCSKVYCVIRNSNSWDAQCKQNPRLIPIVCDVQDWDATQKALAAIGDVVQLVVNNAGMFERKEFADVDPAFFTEIINTNARSVLCVSQPLVKKLVAAKLPGSIVNISSYLSSRAKLGTVVHSASKAMVDSFTRSMANELGVYNIRVNAVNPGLVLTETGKTVLNTPGFAGEYTEKVPLGRPSPVKDVVNTVLFLLSDLSNSTTATLNAVDGGILARI